MRHVQLRKYLPFDFQFFCEKDLKSTQVLIIILPDNKFFTFDTAPLTVRDFLRRKGAIVQCCWCLSSHIRDQKFVLAGIGAKVH